MENNTNRESKVEEGCIDDNENLTSPFDEKQNKECDAAPVASKLISKKVNPIDSSPSPVDTNSDESSVLKKKTTKSSSAGLCPGPEMIEVEEPQPSPTVPGAFAEGGTISAAGKTTSTAALKNGSKTPDGQGKSSKAGNVAAAADSRSGGLPPCPEVLPIEEPVTEIEGNGELSSNSVDVISKTVRDIDLDTDHGPNEILEITGEPTIPTLSEQHKTIIEEPPFPPSSQVNNTATTTDDEDAYTDNFQATSNDTLLPDENELQNPILESSQSISIEGEDTITATAVRHDEQRLVTADCVLAESQLNNQEAIPVDTWKQNIPKRYLNNRRARMVLCIVLVIVIALVVGIVIASTSGDGNSSRSEEKPPLSLSPTASPTISKLPSSSPSISNVPTVAPLWTQVGQDMYGENPFEEFGYSVSITKDGRRVAIGSPPYSKVIENSTYPVEAGRVVIYDNINGDYWNLTGDIFGDSANARFGEYVTFSGDGNRIAIGANRYNDAERGDQTGRVKVFEYKLGSWEPLGDAIVGYLGGSNFGICLAFSGDGDVLAVSAPRHDGLNGSRSGLVRIFRYLNGSWAGMGEAIMGEGAGDRSGHRISMSNDGRVVAIGAHFNEGVPGLDSGHVRVYQYDEGENGTTWKQLGQDIDGEAKKDRFGWSVSLSGDGTILAAGARKSDGGGDDSGDVWVYQYNNETTKWDKIGKITGEAPGDAFGHEVSLSSEGNVVAIAAIKHDGINGIDSGYVQVYKYYLEGQEWTKVGDSIYGKDGGDEFGFSLSISDNGARVAIGGRFNDAAGKDSGMVQIYEMKNI